MIRFLVFLIISFQAFASVKTSGFLDTYYAWDFNRPHNNKRLYTTQPDRHNEPGVNLVYGDVTLDQENTRGRLALQAGNSVIRNTEFEGKTLRFIQEAYVGKRISEKTWIDGGVFLGHIGAESWVSKDNWTYTRAINLDYVPYYATGLRVTHENLQVYLMNGWQNIREDNKAKAIGVQYKKAIRKDLKFTYNNFFGDEEVVSSRPRFRAYHNFVLQWDKDERWQYLSAFDFGHQSQQKNNGIDPWWAVTLTARRVLDEIRSLAFRFEYYADPHEANIKTPSALGFQVTGASVNFDQKLASNILWRNEVRGFSSRAKIYPEHHQALSHLDSFFVTSLSLWLP